MVKAAIFDIDGTLVDSVDLHAQAWKEAFKHFGKDIPYQQMRHQIGKGGDQSIPEAELLAAGCIAIYDDPGDLLARYEESVLGREAEARP